MKKKRVIVVVIIIIIIIIGGSLAFNGLMAHFEKNLEQITVSNVNLSKVEDGIFYGSYKAFPVAAKVKVTVGNHKIIKIDIVEHKNGQGSAAEVITDKVIEAQTLEIDVVSGATYSSNVILKAIENALNKEN